VVFQPLLDQLTHAGRVTDQRLVVEGLQDLVVRHAAPFGRCPSRSANRPVWAMRIGRSASRRSTPRRNIGPEMLTAPTASPVRPRTGAAIEARPGSSSSHAVAQPV